MTERLVTTSSNGKGSRRADSGSGAGIVSDLPTSRQDGAAMRFTGKIDKVTLSSRIYEASAALRRSA